MANPTKFTWSVPTKNTDGSALTSGEVTGYSIGVRAASQGAAGTYPTLTAVADPTATTAAIPALAPGNYAAAIMSLGPNPSAWSPEATFTLAAVPMPPAGFTAA